MEYALNITNWHDDVVHGHFLYTHNVIYAHTTICDREARMKTIDEYVIEMNLIECWIMLPCSMSSLES